MNSNGFPLLRNRSCILLRSHSSPKIAIWCSQNSGFVVFAMPPKTPLCCGRRPRSFHQGGGRGRRPPVRSQVCPKSTRLGICRAKFSSAEATPAATATVTTAENNSNNNTCSNSNSNNNSMKQQQHQQQQHETTATAENKSKEQQQP